MLHVQTDAPAGLYCCCSLTRRHRWRQSHILRSRSPASTLPTSSLELSFLFPMTKLEAWDKMKKKDMAEPMGSATGIGRQHYFGRPKWHRGSYGRWMPELASMKMIGIFVEGKTKCQKGGKSSWRLFRKSKFCHPTRTNSFRLCLTDQEKTAGRPPRFRRSSEAKLLSKVTSLADGVRVSTMPLACALHLCSRETRWW